eukprot:CAMPEP_0197026818 /NCGR_PEP_ID=MMETSP1384-20130603/6838_1 /TAXON_ID=29189 /ORGANISM="Ammonia sp." /LENGTH=498 /DNA_ID=CAMNT_0042455561 /DNA_START=32 /DNA_END=1528 /DNA_ORIENTATION=-
MAQYTVAVDELVRLFPTIERPTVQSILVTECNGDTTKAIVLLTRIQEFNTRINAPVVPYAPQQTGNSGEAVTVSVYQPPPQQIPLSIPMANVHAAHSLNTATVVPTNDCCQDCCVCCAMKPASYSAGLYRIDYAVYNYAFLLFAAFTIYPETVLYSLHQSYQGLYLPTAGLSMFILAALMKVCKHDDKAADTFNFIRGGLYFIGGLLYLLGYIVHAFNITDICDNDSYWSYRYYDYWDCGYWAEDDITPEPEYLIGRGCFVSFHAMFLGLLYVANYKFAKCGCHSRVGLVRVWSFFFLIFALLVLCWIMYPWYYLIYMAFAPVIIQVVVALNCCLIKKSNEAGGCTSGVSLGIILMSAYYFSLLFLVIFIILKSWIHAEHSQQIEYLFWDMSVLLFGAMQLWILSRAMSPVNANCGCTQDGSGDGNVISVARQRQLQQLQVQPQVQPQQQQVIVVQQPQQQIGMVPVVTAAALPVQDQGGYEVQADDRDSDDEGDGNQ